MSKFVSSILLLTVLLMLGVVNSLAQGEDEQSIDDIVCESDVIVKANDSISKIAEENYGNPLFYPAIFNATNGKAESDDSYAKIESADTIDVGEKLCIVSYEKAIDMVKTSGAVAELLEEIIGSSTNSSITQPTSSEKRLDIVESRGKVICGGHTELPGFGLLQDNTYSGFDLDFCKAVSVAIFGKADDSTLEILHIEAPDREAALEANTIDVLIRNTTYTLKRDTEWADDFGADFGPITFYDGQGIMVRTKSGIEELEDLEGGSVCVTEGTTTLLNLYDEMDARGINYTPMLYDTDETLLAAYENKACDALTSDKSNLISQRQKSKKPIDHIILKEFLSKEPLAPAYAHGDSEWGNVIDWTVYCTIRAEELEIDSNNIDDEMISSNDPSVKRLLGVEGELGRYLGLENDFCANIIREVGNYGEIYDRNLGPDTPFKLPRGLNSLWAQGGLLYSPPFR